LAHSGRSGTSDGAASRSWSSKRLSKSKPTSPTSSARFSFTADSTAPSWISTSARRVCPSESNAPALTSDSTVRLFATWIGDLLQEVVERLEPALRLARRADRVDHVEADVAHRAEPEPDVVADGREVADRLVHVGREHLDAHAAALVEVERELVARVADAREQAAMYSAG
jgi:hypothetical protein